MFKVDWRLHACYLEVVLKPHLTSDSCVAPQAGFASDLLGKVQHRPLQNAHIPMYAALFHRPAPYPRTRSEVLKPLLIIGCPAVLKFPHAGANATTETAERFGNMIFQKRFLI